MPAPSREDIAKQEIGHTDVSPAQARLWTAMFLLLIFGYPLLQAWTDRARPADEPPALATLHRFPEAAAKGWASRDSFFGSLFRANAEILAAIQSFEDDVEDQSLLRGTLIEPVQRFMTGVFNRGNETAFQGRDGWLYFHSDVDYSLSPPFLDPLQIQRRTRSGNEFTAPPQPDPRLAILEFHAQLRERGISLVILPVPVKQVVHAEGLAWSLGADHPALHNLSYEAFLTELHAAGVRILDPTPGLLKRKQGESPVYLKTDTHWTFETVQWMASELTAFLGIASADPSFREEEVRHLGDIAQMLGLGENQTLIAPETQTLRVPVELPRDGERILLLGDSFTNIYSMPELGWGEGAGLAEQLSALSGRPVTKIAINAGGGHAARFELLRRLQRGDDALENVDTVIWQFASRELSQGDWRLMPLPEPAPRETTETTSAGTVSATVIDRTHAPRPGSVPYRDALVAFHLRLAAPGDLPREILVYTWGLRENVLISGLPESGATARLRLQPWSEVEARVGSLNRNELLSDDTLLLDLYWAEEIHKNE